MSSLIKSASYAVWTLNGYLARPISLETSKKVTVLITYFNPARMAYIETQIRNILKCNFVERIIISNHNPDVHIEDRVSFRNDRLVFLNQSVKRGCGYRWSVAAEFDPEYLIVIDDDLWLYPPQLANLFSQLIKEPEIPHGFTGMLKIADDAFEYHERQEMVVDFLCEIYAVTKNHLARYQELEKSLNKNHTVASMIAKAADFMVISQSGKRQPKIHRTARLFRSPTFNEVGVAVHKEDGFDRSMFEVSQALTNVLTSMQEPDKGE